MATTLQDIDIGGAPDDTTGTPAYTAGGWINDNSALIETKLDELESANWRIKNTSYSIQAGEQILVTNTTLGAIVLDFQPASPISTQNYNHIFVVNNCRVGNDLTLQPSIGEEFYYQGAYLAVDETVTLPNGYVALVLSHNSQLIMWRADGPAGIGDLSDVDMTTTPPSSTGQIITWDNVGNEWVPDTPANAGIMIVRDPLIESAVCAELTDHGTIAASGTCFHYVDEYPAGLVTIGGNNVTIELNVPVGSLPHLGKSAIKYSGVLHVLIDGTARTGLTVTTDATTKLATFPKGTAPTAANERATLAYYWWDNGTTDFLWAEWVNEV